MGLEAEIWAWRLGGGGGTEEEEKEKKEEKIPQMCESIGHRSLRGRCPKRVKVTDGWSEGRVVFLKFGRVRN